MKQELTLFIADDSMNSVMQMFDMRPDYKWFVSPQQISFESNELLSEEKIMRIINAGFPQEVRDQYGFWIPAVSYIGNLFHHPSVKILSDGQKESFIERYA